MPALFSDPRLVVALAAPAALADLRKVTLPASQVEDLLAASPSVKLSTSLMETFQMRTSAASLGMESLARHLESSVLAGMAQ